MAFISFLILFVFGWLSLGWFSSSSGGWIDLANLYRTDIDFEHQIRGGSIRLETRDGFTYSNTGGVDIGIDEQGVYIKPVFVFSFKKSPLLLVWESIENCSFDRGWLHLRMSRSEVSVFIQDENKALYRKCIEESGANLRF